MEVVDLSHNDDLISVIKKCNLNFKQLSYALTQSARKQRRIDSQDISEALRGLSESIAGLADQMVELQDVVIPNAIADAIAALDVPGQIAMAIPDAYPPIGSYEISDTVPAYDGTTWQQVGTVETTGSLFIPLWQRTA